MFNEPEIELEKFRQSLKFHENHQNQYIEFLENKIKCLIKENNTLRESIKNKANLLNKVNSSDNNI